MSTPTTSKTHPAAAANVNGNGKLWAIVGAIAAVVIVVLVIILVKASGTSEPRLNESTPTLSKFVATKDFESMAFEKRRLYYKVLDDRGKEIDDAFKEHRITEPEYRNALEAAWLGKHINRSEKYASMGPAARTEYVSQLLTKKAKKDAKPGSKDEKDEEDVKVDETAAELRVESWPAAARDQWNVFHNAYKLEKKVREQAATKPAK